MLRKLNSELFSYQNQVAQVLNVKMLKGSSAVSIEEKEGVFRLVRDYLVQAYRKLLPSPPRTFQGCIAAMADLPDWAGLLGSRKLAVPLSVAARSFRLAILTDRSLLGRLLDATLLIPTASAIGLEGDDAKDFSDSFRACLFSAASN